MFVGQQEPKDQQGDHYTCPALDPMRDEPPVLEDMGKVECMPRVFTAACSRRMVNLQLGHNSIFPEGTQLLSHLDP